MCIFTDISATRDMSCRLFAMLKITNRIFGYFNNHLVCFPCRNAEQIAEHEDETATFYQGWLARVSSHVSSVVRHLLCCQTVGDEFRITVDVVPTVVIVRIAV